MCSYRKTIKTIRCIIIRPYRKEFRTVGHWRKSKSGHTVPNISGTTFLLNTHKAKESVFFGAINKPGMSMSDSFSTTFVTRKKSRLFDGLLRP